MFEAAELGRKISSAEYEKQLPELRNQLVQAQVALKKSHHSVIIIVSGVDGAGKGEAIHRLNGWLDPRGIDTNAFWEVREEEKVRPPNWKYWRALPQRGRIAIFFGSWYTDPITRRVYGKIKTAQLDQQLKRIASFESMLVDDGTIFIKLWFHLSESAQYNRLKSLEKSPETHWRILPTDWKHHKLYDRFVTASERAIRQTDSPKAPWFLIEAVDVRYRDLTTGRIIVECLQRGLAGENPASASKTRVSSELNGANGKAAVTILDHVDLTRSASTAKYERQLLKYQARLNYLTWEAHKKKIATVVVFEGWDASGKGSAIRRTTEAVDPRLYRVIPIAAPTDEERAHHYLWRFWRQLPRAGDVAIFDRSWYGRLLVERVEELAREDEWRRAYREINEFEEELVEDGMVLVKCWIHISKEEQLKRFRKREEIAFKRYKITPDDWRNRKKWNAYKDAVNDMVARTSTEFAPWTIVPGDDKKYARMRILKSLCNALEDAL